MSEANTKPCPSPTCPCSECMSARIPNTCPEGCACCACFVDSLSDDPPPRRATSADVETAT